MVVDESDGSIVGLDNAPVRRRWHSPRLEKFVHLALRFDGWVLPRADSVNIKAQSPEPINHRCALDVRFRICLLAETPGCRVPRVRKLFLPDGVLALVQCLKLGGLEKHFAANLDHVGNSGTGQSLRDAGDVSNVFRHVFTNHTVSARGGLHENTVFVTHVEGEPVNLHFAQPAGLVSSVASDLGDPGAELVVRENVVEAVHALAVRDGRE